VGSSPKGAAWLVAAALAATACGGGDTTKPPPPTPPCNTSAGQPVTLNVGDYEAIPPLANAGCLSFPGNASLTDSARYLLVPQLATDEEGATAAFVLKGDTLHPVAAAPSARTIRPGPSLGDQFHDFLRAQERNHFAALRPPSGVAPAGPSQRVPPPVVGDQRTFKVCAKTDCSSLLNVTATAKTVNGHLAIYVDNAAPANGLTQADLDSLGALFDTRLYAIDTTAYGRESDIDSNTVVVVLMTGVVNKLVTTQQCSQSGFIAGFFFGADIDPTFASSYNHGEVFYSIVADSTGTLSCAHTARRLKQLVPVTFTHEFQHMISYNQHVLVRSGPPQATWLDEGLSHFAEELAGRSFLPGDTATFSDFLSGDMLNSYRYLDSPGEHFLAYSTGIGETAERGAAWLFVRYLADHFAADSSFASVAAFTRRLSLATLEGGAAVADATGLPFETVVERWALANYVSGLPGFSAPPELTYASWDFRSTFAALHAQRPDVFGKPFPLTPPETAGPAVSLAETLWAGSGWYAVAFQPPGAPGFNLLFSGPGGNALPGTVFPRLGVIRIH
jgi:hypothetical protein